VAVALLKLPSGVLTAILGLLLMRGEFVPGLSALDSSAQIVAWAIIFGYSQQLFTRAVDNRAKTVLDNVKNSRLHEANGTA
jgi:chromate transport protein ChrA